jgi:hypothetical protein
MGQLRDRMEQDLKLKGVSPAKAPPFLRKAFPPVIRVGTR